jgi:hypothetical protein
MTANSNKLDVYPDLASIFHREGNQVADLFRESSQVDVPRQFVLTDFYGQLNQEIDKLGKKDLTEADLEVLF